MRNLVEIKKKIPSMAGQMKMTISQLEDEIKTDSEIGHKLRQIEHELEY